MYIPYRGATPALQDIMGNTDDLFFDNLSSSMNLRESGKLRILGVCDTNARYPCRMSRRFRKPTYPTSPPSPGLQ
jgi:tripartite-type tricarboxylate transporter receptor subunit TctC